MVVDLMVVQWSSNDCAMVLQVVVMQWWHNGGLMVAQLCCDGRGAMVVGVIVRWRNDRELVGQ